MINTQYLQYVREQLMVATADLSGATKGQLVAFAENAMFEATPRSRGRKKVYDPQKKRMVNPDSPPIDGSQSRAKGSAIALVLPVEYSTASWRRALLSLEEHQKSWLLWNYSENICFDHQVAREPDAGPNCSIPLVRVNEEMGMPVKQRECQTRTGYKRR